MISHHLRIILSGKMNREGDRNSSKLYEKRMADQQELHTKRTVMQNRRRKVIGLVEDGKDRSNRSVLTTKGRNVVPDLVPKKRSSASLLLRDGTMDKSRTKIIKKRGSRNSMSLASEAEVDSRKRLKSSNNVPNKCAGKRSTSRNSLARAVSLPEKAIESNNDTSGTCNRTSRTMSARYHQDDNSSIEKEAIVNKNGRTEAQTDVDSRDDDSGSVTNDPPQENSLYKRLVNSNLAFQSLLQKENLNTDSENSNVVMHQLVDDEDDYQRQE